MYPLVRCPLALLLGTVLSLSSPARADSPSRATLARAGKAASAFVQAKGGSGSAFCIHPSGLFLTNHHVIESGGDITLVLNANRKDQRVVKAQVLRSDPETDLALLRAEGVKDLPTLPIGRDETLSEGDEVVACGFPLGKRLALARDEYPAITITFGKVTALRQRSGELELIQLDVELHPGNSGGPILGNDGKVVGVAVAVVRGTNFRLAIPVRKVHRFLEGPVLSFRPPRPGPDEWRMPLDFEAHAVSFLPTEIPFRAELLLRDRSGKVRKYPMKQVGHAFKATAPLLTDSVDVRMVCCTVVVSQDGKELARLGRWVVQDGDVSKRYLADMSVYEFKKGEWDLSIGYVNFPPWIVSPIRVGGQPSPRGLSTFPNCSVSYRLRKHALLFRSQVGIDDTGRGNRAGPITFAVFGDGKALWTSKPLYTRGEKDDCEVDVSGVEMLELRVSVEEHEIGPHAVWLEPYILTDDPQWRAEPAMVVGAKDRTIAKLPCAVGDVALGGGGRYLVVTLPKVGKLAVLDVLDPHALKFIALEEAGPVLVAAGADKLLVLYTDPNILDRYSLTTLKKEAGMDLPFEGKVFSLAMGSASDETLLAVGNKPLTGGALLVDVQKMRKLRLGWKGNNAAHVAEGAVAWASADGRVFGVGCANDLWRGFHTICLEEGTATIYSSQYVPSYACPGSNGRLVFTGSGLYTSHLQSPRNQPSHRGTPCLPAAQGDLFMKAGRDSLALFPEAGEEPLVKVTGLDLPEAAVKNRPLPFVKRVYLVPEANVIITIPGGGEEIHFHRFAFAKALEHAKGDYLFVTAFAPPRCKKGHRFIYELHAWSKKGGVKYQILSAPKGMTVSANGKAEWNVPQDAAEGVTEVRLLVQDASALKVNHSFRVRVE